MIVFIAIASVLLASAIGWAVWPLLQRVVTVTLATGFIMVTATVLYWYSGNPEGIFLSPEATASTPTPLVADQEAIMQMIAGLKARLDQSSGDVNEWLMLGRSYAVIGRFDEALNTYQHAHTVLGDLPDLLADWAEVELHTQNNVFSLTIIQRLEQVLAKNPDHGKALWLGGFAALQGGNKALALSRWQRLLVTQPPDSDSSLLITQLINELNDDPISQKNHDGVVQNATPSNKTTIK